MKLTAKKPTYKVFAQDGNASAWVVVEMSKEEIAQQTYQVVAVCTNCGYTSPVVIQKGIGLEKVVCLNCEVPRLTRADAKAKGNKWL